MTPKRLSKTTNPCLKDLILLLKKKNREEKNAIWHDVSERLSKTRRRRSVVNLSRINRNTKDNDLVLVPGKVLGSGRIDHPVTITAFNFSSQALLKIEKAGGKSLMLEDFIQDTAKIRNIKIIG